MRVPHIVFATAFDHYAVQAFDVNAVDYVLKPFDKARLAKAIARAKKMLDANISPSDKFGNSGQSTGAGEIAAGEIVGEMPAAHVAGGFGRCGLREHCGWIDYRGGAGCGRNVKLSDD